MRARARVLSMHPFLMMTRLALLGLAAWAAATLVAAAQPVTTASQSDPDRPVTPPDSYRVVMENDRVRMIEIHVKPRSKVNVDSPPDRERFLYMLSDGALVLAPPGKTPYEFALHAGETAVFPAVSPTVANDTDAAVRALMVEVKAPMRSAASKAKGGKFAKGKGRSKVAAKSGGTKSAAKSKTKSKQAAKPRKQASAKPSANAPLNLSKANARPAKKLTGKKGRGSDG
jgi:hypothetical protein